MKFVFLLNGPHDGKIWGLPERMMELKVTINTEPSWRSRAAMEDYYYRPSGQTYEGLEVWKFIAPDRTRILIN